jgi:hypothetical protein
MQRDDLQRLIGAPIPRHRFELEAITEPLTDAIAEHEWAQAERRRAAQRLIDHLRRVRKQIDDRGDEW